jgi:hypothetical protein
LPEFSTLKDIGLRVEMNGIPDFYVFLTSSTVAIPIANEYISRGSIFGRPATGDRGVFSCESISLDS